MCSTRFTILVVIIASLWGCDNSFTPKTEFSPQLVAFLVLDNTNDITVVRLARTYDAELGDIGNPITPTTIDSARVELRHGAKLYVFRDTVIDEERVWFNPDVEVEQNGEYRLLIIADEFEEVRIAINVPSDPQISMRINTDPGRRVESIRLVSNALSQEVLAKGYLFRLEFRYLDESVSPPVLKVVDVPVGHSEETGEYYYPQVQREDIISFRQYYLRAALDQLGVVYDSAHKVTAYGYMYSLDENFFNYYKLVRGFDDPATVRLDHPDITNLGHVRGVYGAILRDSTMRRPYNAFSP